jgi:hypothetical protein
MQVKLAVIDGPHAGKEFLFAERDSFLVGRSKEAHFSLPRDDPYFSRKHFLVEVNPPRCRLLDLKSRNGTLVNGRCVQSVELRDGDKIKAGHTVLQLSIEQPPPSDLPKRADADATLDLPKPGQRKKPLPRPKAAPPDPVPGGVIPRGILANSPKPESPVAPAATPGPAPAEPASTPTLVQPSGGPQTFGGVTIPGYRPLKVLGEGGMGVVYLATRTTDGVEVAVKMLKTARGVGDAAVQRFLREARILGKLNHPNIVGFHETGAVGRDPYIVMEFVKGADASTALKKDGPLPVYTAVAYACQLLDALEYAHGRGFVHRDVKPANMLIEERGRERVVKLADFGLARAYEASQLSGVTLPGDQGGTVAFMAPEQVTHFRDAKAAADQYSAAASLYHLLTGCHVFDFADGVHPLIQILTEKAVPLRRRRSEVPVKLAEAVHRALAKEPAERFPDVVTFRVAIQGFE